MAYFTSKTFYRVYLTPSEVALILELARGSAEKSIAVVDTGTHRVFLSPSYQESLAYAYADGRTLALDLTDADFVRLITDFRVRVAVPYEFDFELPTSTVRFSVGYSS